MLEVDLDISWHTKIDSAILVLRGVLFSDYRIRLNPNKQNGGKVVGVIPYLSLRFLYIGNDPRNDCRVRVFQRMHLKYITQPWCLSFSRNIWFLTCSCFRESADQHGHQIVCHGHKLCHNIFLGRGYGMSYTANKTKQKPLGNSFYLKYKTDPTY